MSKKSQTLHFVGALLILALVFFQGLSFASADTITDLKQKISDHSTQIDELEKEIASYESQLVDIGKQKATLASKIQSLDLTQKKLATDIAVTQQKIDQANLEIDKLSLEIGDKQSGIAEGDDTLRQTMRAMNQDEDKSLVEVMLSTDSLATFFDDITSLEKLQGLVQENIDTLQALKTDLEGKRTAQEDAEKKLEDLKAQLSDQRKIVASNKAEETALLNATKNKESNYAGILASKKELQAALEQELLDYESQLKVAIDPNSYPAPGTRVLAWPLSKVIITQYFGDTAFAKSGAYNGKGHNGVDFGASIGTPIMAAADGVVLGSGNTDLACPGASYGQWVLIKHPNGLATIYAHLSLIKASQGDIVKQGTVIGYSGDTGYVTGPHLHFGVYAAQGVKIDKLQSRVCNATYTLPIAPLNGYLNPMDYLPSQKQP